MKKKVLVWETLATVSGGQKMTLAIMDMLADEYEFCCLIPAKGMLSSELERRNIPYVLMGDQALPTGVKEKQVIFRYGWMSAKNICKSLRAIWKYKPDILYCPGPAALPWSAICGSMMKKPVIWHLHHIFLDGATKKLLNICGCLRFVRKIIAVSNCVGEQIANKNAKEKLKILYNPVNINKYANGDPVKMTKEIGRILNFREQSRTRTLVIGHIALIQQSKRQDFVLEVISALKTRGYNVVGIFAGETREQTYMEELEQLASNLDLLHQVVFLGRRDDIPDVLKSLDLLLIPSAEGFPLAALEAASAGVPIVACNTAGAKEFIEVSGAGVTFIQNDVESAAEAVLQAVGRRNTFRANGVNFSQNMTVSNYQKRLVDIFTDCTSR